jgi:DNA-binding response OmpR family regulator
MNTTPTCRRAILLIEDNEDDTFLMKRALKEAGFTNALHVVQDGEQAVEYLDGTGRLGDREGYPLPALIFLDLKLPGKSGHEVLTWLRAQSHLDATVVVVLTSSDEGPDVKKAYSLGADSYLVKPPTGDKLTKLSQAFNWSWLELQPQPEPH